MTLRLASKATRLLHLDRTVLFALLTRFWQMAAGPLAIVLIVRYFSPEEQGFYYTFASLIALQSFFELGFYLVIVNVASHEWAHLQIGRDGYIEGDPNALSRVVSLGRLIFRWYGIASSLFVVVVAIAGFLFFSQQSYSGVNWQGPWFALVVLYGLVMFGLPFNSLLEGCGQIRTVYLARLVQVILGTAVLAGALIAGWGLWASALVTATMVGRDVVVLLFRYRRFFAPFVRPPRGPVLRWRDDLWPMQWRIGLSGLVNYFSFSIFNPVMFQFHGAVVAGQMGMTWQALYAFQAFGLAWVYANVPGFGALIAKRDYETLNARWRKISIVSTAAVATAVMAFDMVIFLLPTFAPDVGERFLPIEPTLILGAGTVLMQVSQCQTAYMRAHKEEPILVMSVTTSLVIGALAIVLGSQFGPTGAAVGYTATMAIGVLWETSIFNRFRATHMAVTGVLAS